MDSSHKLITRALNMTVIVASLGYFVDIYDLTLFSIVRTPSLKALGYSGSDLMAQGVHLINIQMLGMLIGGIIWGIWGDKRGRLSVLFLTILLYSLANIANAYAQNITQYAIFRFLAGLGLAGELGVGITLVSEIMTTETRGYGTSIVGLIGILGTVLGFSVTTKFSWKAAYLVGGILGLLLLVLRLYVSESGMFNKLKTSSVSKGNFFMLFTNKKRFFKYLYCILLGVPVWFVIGVLITFSPEFAKVLNIQGNVNAGAAMMYHYIGASLGSLFWGLMSQWLHSRKKSVWLAMSVLVFFTAAYFGSFGMSAFAFYLIIFFLGVAQGYWIVFVTIASEQFGTNLRATVTTTVPNFVRGSTIGVTSLVVYLETLQTGLWQGSLGKWWAALITAVICIGLSLFSLYKLEETYSKDLDYMED